MRKLKLSFALLAAAFMFNSNLMAQSATASGSVAIINEIDAFVPVTTLDLDANTALTAVASITVSNNYENAWDLKLAFTNDGVFRRYAAADGDASTDAAIGGEIPIDAFSLIENATPGTLGTGLTAPSGTFTLTTDAGADYYIFDTQSKQTTATVDYKMDILCSWTATSADLQGTYSETITATLTAGDGN